MLTPDLVHARRQKDELKLVGLGARREQAMELAEMVVELAKEHVGRPREELEQAWQAIEVEPRDRKLLDGMTKLVEDALVFDSEVGDDAPALRAEVFRRATEARRALGDDALLDRSSVLADVATKHGMDPETLDRALYGDLRSAHLLREVRAPGPRALVEGYDLAQAQAVLLRATKVVAILEDIEPAAMRALFRKLKFLRLLYSIRAEGPGKWRLDIDGPFSLFESVTKYGLALALALPAIASSGTHRVVADVRWGKERLPLRFVMEGSALGSPKERGRDEIPARLSDEAEALRARIEEKGGAWRAEVADVILDLPGVGACVPDLVCTHRASGARVLVEVMGYWSRDAVWKRVELAEKGLSEPVLFCVSERLRVSEAVLPDDAPAALLVFKGVIPIGALLEKLEALRRR
ncbi:DUF790 family protein [Sandaracinus amylolyticus]|uniref:DUF790 family protein n=1 Tax=Sandaracinus amylolyticus TaxID=927083 RepID=A0A0F6W4W4_9BACT|nr:DUF790 family protein [Sandaracinus amylolyticus]AKF07492.1 Hypothetical protein DB32_004641 [Sandaracinus amylolyticus]